MRHKPWHGVLFVVLCVVLAACAQMQTQAQPQSQTHAVSDKQGSKREDAARVYVELGQRYMEQGKYEIALDNLQKALQHDSNYTDAHTVIAVLYEQLGDSKHAEEHYQRAAELSPKAGITNNNYGTFLCKLGKLDQAQKYFDRAFADPFYKTPEVAYTNAGTCLMRESGKLGEAEADFRRALELSPNSREALYQLADVLYRKDDFFHARAFIQRFESLGQPSAEALLLGYNIETRIGHAEAAHDYAQRLREQFPDSEQTHKLESLTPAS